MYKFSDFIAKKNLSEMAMMTPQHIDNLKAKGISNTQEQINSLIKNTIKVIEHILDDSNSKIFTLDIREFDKPSDQNSYQNRSNLTSHVKEYINEFHKIEQTLKEKNILKDFDFVQHIYKVLKAFNDNDYFHPRENDLFNLIKERKSNHQYLDYINKNIIVPLNDIHNHLNTALKSL